MPIKSKLLRGVLAGGLAAALTAGVAFASIGTGTVTAEPSLRMRSQPNTSSSTLTTAPTNAAVDVLEDAGNGWYKVSYHDVEGYMSGEWLSITLDGGEDDNSAVPPQDAAPQEPDTVPQEPAPAPAAETGSVNAGPLNVRSGPGTGYGKVGSLSKGAAVTVAEKLDGWYKITSGSVSGYVSAQYITLDTVAAPAPAEPAPADPAPAEPAEPAAPEAPAEPVDSSEPASPAEAEQGYVNDGPLNVRSGPGTGYGRVGSLSVGTAVTVTEKLDGWYKITSGSVSGYVSAQYITLGDPPKTQTGSTNSNAAASSEKGWVNTSALNIRSGPGTGYDKVGSLSMGTSVTISETVDGWYKITSGSVSGYVSADYITLGDAPASTVSGNSLGAQAAALAKQQVGKRYVYGATGPYAFDCSGLTYYIYRTLGVNIARGSSSQYYNTGYFVSANLNTMQPGDLLFFFDRAYDSSGGRLPTTHVGIYIGNNKFIHASTPSSGVRMDTLFGGYHGSHLVGVKRVG